MIDTLDLDKLRELESKATKGPWNYCGEKNEKPCKCGAIWSKPADHPVVRVERGEWGDRFPTFEIVDDSESGSISRTATIKATQGFIPYGKIPDVTADANSGFIAAARNAMPQILDLIESQRQEIEDSYKRNEILWCDYNGKEAEFIGARQEIERLREDCALKDAGYDVAMNSARELKERLDDAKRVLVSMPCRCQEYDECQRCACLTRLSHN